MAMGYSVQLEGGVKARGTRLNVSPKQAMEVCNAVRGMKVSRAEKFLENVIEGKEYVEYKRFNKKIPHRTGGKPGRFPKKASGMVLNIIKNAVNNAEQKGMDAEKLKIVHSAAHKGPVYQRRASKGRMKTSNIETVHIEIVVKEA